MKTKDINKKKSPPKDILPSKKDNNNNHPAVVEYDPLLFYLREISKYPLLTREEEKELTRSFYDTRDPETASRIVSANLRLVVKIAMDFQKFWIQNFLDLIQEGNIGLMQAVNKFDPYKGVKFSYYASFWIKAYILKFIMDNWRLVKIGTTQAQRKLFYNLQKEKDRLRALGFEPTPKMIAQKLDVKEKEVVQMEQRLGVLDLSLDAPISRDSTDTHITILPSPGKEIEKEFAKKEALGNLSTHYEEFRTHLKGKEKEIFEKRLLAENPVTLHELGKEFGLSRERVRQIETKIKSKLKKFLKKRIPDLLDYKEIINENS
jgi:RNA polymerase sigma-32 factor